MIYETEDAYVCESVVRNDNPCKPKGRLGRIMCQYEIPREQAIKFFTEGKTDLIDKWISKRGRPFSAYLACETEGKMVLKWEFPEREVKLDAEGNPIKPRGRFPVRKKAAAK
jgi:DNA topoisomerase-3